VADLRSAHDQKWIAGRPLVSAWRWLFQWVGGCVTIILFCGLVAFFFFKALAAVLALLLGVS